MPAGCSGTFRYSNQLNTVGNKCQQKSVVQDCYGLAARDMHGQYPGNTA